jgi:hypothetical protein
MLPILVSEQAQVANTLKPTEIQFLRQYLACLELMNLASFRHLVMWYAGCEMVVWQVMDSGSTSRTGSKQRAGMFTGVQFNQM